MYFREYCKRIFKNTNIIIAIVSTIVAVIVALIAAKLIENRLICMIFQILCFAVICAMVPSINAESTKIMHDLDAEMGKTKKSTIQHKKKKK